MDLDERGKYNRESKHERIPESLCSAHLHSSVLGKPELKLSKLVELKCSIKVIQILPLH